MVRLGSFNKLSFVESPRRPNVRRRLIFRRITQIMIRWKTCHARPNHFQGKAESKLRPLNCVCITVHATYFSQFYCPIQPAGMGLIICCTEKPALSLNSGTQYISLQLILSWQYKFEAAQWCGLVLSDNLEPIVCFLNCCLVFAIIPPSVPKTLFNHKLHLCLHEDTFCANSQDCLKFAIETV
jgi:hypothetical protein